MKENMSRVLPSAAKGTKFRSRAIPLTNLIRRRQATPESLAKKDFDFRWDTGPPDLRKPIGGRTTVATGTGKKNYFASVDWFLVKSQSTCWPLDLCVALGFVQPCCFLYISPHMERTGWACFFVFVFFVGAGFRWWAGRRFFFFVCWALFCRLFYKV